MYAIAFAKDNDQSIQIVNKSAIDIILESIRDLNSNDLTIITIYGPHGDYMMVGGGVGKYIVSGSARDGRIFSLLNLLGRKDETVEMVCGGQFSDYPTEVIVDLDAALEAARLFALAGQFDQKKKWRFE